MKKKKTEPWLTKGILQSIKKQKCLYTKWAKNKTCDIAHEKYTSHRNVLKRFRRYSKRKYYANKCEAYKSNTKQLQKLINKCSGKLSDKSCLIDYLTIDGSNNLNLISLLMNLQNSSLVLGKSTQTRSSPPHTLQNIT